MRLRKVAACALLIMLVASCASQPIPDAYDPPGFFSGIFHGWIAIFALIGHLFDPSIRVYAFPHSGGWYDLGFIIGVGCLGAGANS